MLDDFEPLTDAQVQAGARPGESWEAARRRLEEARQVGTDTGGIIVSWPLRATRRKQSEAD